MENERIRALYVNSPSLDKKILVTDGKEFTFDGKGNLASVKSANYEKRVKEIMKDIGGEAILGVGNDYHIQIFNYVEKPEINQ